MTGRGIARRCLPLVVFLTLAATAAHAADPGAVLWRALSGRVVFSVLLLLFCQALFVLAFARILGLAGGFGSAVIAVGLGGIVVVVFTVMIALFGFFLPQIVLGAMVTALPFLCGALGVKWAFGTDLGHGLVVFLLSLSAASLVAMGYLLLAF
ncbi:MAG TPA: hypothetical protein VLB51_15630 [Methylomirabilota bacterium]|nr:hypothetical protein [Methylomirabilota bacterium]